MAPAPAARSLREAATLAVAAGLTSVVAGCGGAHRTSNTSVLRQGRAIFAQSCARCHTLTGHDTGAPGGDLAIARLDVRDLASFARIMPVRPRLSDADVKSVAEYIHASSRRR